MQERILRIPFSDIVYEEKTIPMYQPRKFPSADVSPQFIYWLVGQEEAMTPKLADVRDAVIDAWKLSRRANWHCKRRRNKQVWLAKRARTR